MGNETNGNGSSNGSGGAALDEARVLELVRRAVREELSRLFASALNSEQLRRLRILGGSSGQADDGDALATILGRMTVRAYVDIMAEPSSQALFQRLERQQRGRETLERAASLRAVAEAAEREAQEALQRRDLPAEMRGGLATVARERAAAAREQATQLGQLGAALMQ